MPVVFQVVLSQHACRTIPGKQRKDYSVVFDLLPCGSVPLFSHKITLQKSTPNGIVGMRSRTYTWRTC